MAIEIAQADLDLSALVRPGDTIMWSQATSEPISLIEAFVAQRHAIGRTRVFLGSSYCDAVKPEHADAMDFIGIGAVGRTRMFLKAGVLGVIPCHVSDIPTLIRTGSLKIDVVFVQTSENAQGKLSYGAVCSYLPEAIEAARVVIAEVNEQAPWTFSRASISPDSVDYVVRTSRPLATLPVRQPSAEERAIALHVAEIVPEGAILQIGIGTLPDAITASLQAHRDLGIHSGIISDGVVDLVERGVVTNATKPVDRGVSVTGGLFGSSKLYAFANNNPALRVDPMTYTNSIDVLRRFDAFVTINATIEVDLTGQVNGEVAGGNYLGTVGGQTDFARGAASSKGGKSIVALPSRTADGATSRIVSSLSGGVVSAARADADLVVSEYGVAELRGKTIPQRVRSMIGIAHPDFRESLSRKAREIPGMI